jgi:hypothetical protein
MGREVNQQELKKEELEWERKNHEGAETGNQGATFKEAKVEQQSAAPETEGFEKWLLGLENRTSAVMSEEGH